MPCSTFAVAARQNSNGFGGLSALFSVLPGT